MSRTSTGSEPFSRLISLDATAFVLLSVLISIETICPKIWSKLRLKSAKSPLPVDVRRSKTSLRKLPIFSGYRCTSAHEIFANLEIFQAWIVAKGMHFMQA